MIVWVFMILDILYVYQLGLFALAASYSLSLLLFLSFYLIGKGLLFRDVMSIIDAGFGIYTLFALLFGIGDFFYGLIFFWILYKVIALIAPFLGSLS